MITIENTTNAASTQNVELVTMAIVATMATLNGIDYIFPVDKNLDLNISPKCLIATIRNLLIVLQIKTSLKNMFDNAINIDDSGKCTILDNETVIKKLSEIIDKYGWDYDMSVDDFMRNIDRTAPLKYYPITDLKYVPLALMGYLKNNDLIKDIEINLAKWSLINYYSYNYNFTASFKIIIDVTLLSGNNETEQRKTLTPQQKRIYDFVVKKIVSTGVKKIYKFQLEKDLKIKRKNLSEAIKKLNKQYVKINNGYMNSKLLSSKRGHEYYDVNDEWYESIIKNN